MRITINNAVIGNQDVPGACAFNLRLCQGAALGFFAILVVFPHASSVPSSVKEEARQELQFAVLFAWLSLDNGERKVP